MNKVWRQSRERGRKKGREEPVGREVGRERQSTGTICSEYTGRSGLEKEKSTAGLNEKLFFATKRK